MRLILILNAVCWCWCCSRGSGAVPAAHDRYLDRHADRRLDVHPAARTAARSVDSTCVWFMVSFDGTIWMCYKWLADSSLTKTSVAGLLSGILKFLIVEAFP